MLLGEAEILGQVREAYLRAHDGHATGPVLNRLFQAALEVGKRVRAETELGTRPMGVASAGMKLAERIFGKLNERSALVLGAGTISEQVVSQLRDRNIGHLYVTNRSREKAEEFAKQYNGKVIEWGEWDYGAETAGRDCVGGRSAGAAADERADGEGDGGAGESGAVPDGSGNAAEYCAGGGGTL